MVDVNKLFTHMLKIAKGILMKSEFCDIKTVKRPKGEPNIDRTYSLGLPPTRKILRPDRNICYAFVEEDTSIINKIICCLFDKAFLIICGLVYLLCVLCSNQ